MSDGRDDEALSWAGDDDPTLDPQGGRREVAERVQTAKSADAAQPIETAPPVDAMPAEAQAPVVSSPRSAAARRAAGTEAAVVTAVEPSSEQMSSPMLVTLGIFGGVFLLYAVGWTISAFRPDVPPPADIVGASMFQLGQVLAILAAPAWMAATLWLTDRSKPWFRIAILVIGVVVLLPWPFLRGV
ncbi:hypothetical protein ACL9RL_16860 [Plantibacter sp. Mn2098]|uniref:hypothetical protein n=1 Tax=Plantibacter sp. Mn2098 TaxID=3395266 RepID=UPI003BCCA0FB